MTTTVNVTKAGSQLIPVNVEGSLADYTYMQIIEMAGFEASEVEGRKIRDDFRTVADVNSAVRADVSIIVISAPKADNGGM